MLSKSFLVFIATAITVVNAAVPPVFVKQNVNWTEHQFLAPGPGDVRGPCPGLNTLANHGFLNRTGRDISPEEILQASLDVYNIHPDLLVFPTKLGLTTSDSVNVMSLEGIRMHNNMEHDASLSRSDYALGDNFSFNETVYTTLASSNPGVDYYNATSAGWTLKERLRVAKLDNPGLKNTIKEFGFRNGESQLYLIAMGDVITGQAPKKYVDVFFREDRLPLEEGWTVPPNQFNTSTGLELGPLIAAAAEPWGPTEGQEASIGFVTVGTNTLVV